MKSVFCVTIILMAFLFSGCQSGGGVVIEDAQYSMAEIRKAANQVLVEVRSVSENGRDVLSHYYDESGKFISNPEKVRKRYYSLVHIDGTRRPYDIDVQVILEEKIEGEFEDVGLDETKSQTLANKLREHLNQSRSKRNVVDDFKPF